MQHCVILKAVMFPYEIKLKETLIKTTKVHAPAQTGHAQTKNFPADLFVEDFALF